MQKYDITMIGHISRDIMIFHDQTRNDFLGGPVVYSSASASRSGSRVLILTKAAREDMTELTYLKDDMVDLEIIPSPQSTSIRNIYLTPDQERRNVTLLSQAEPFSMADIPEIESRIFHLAGLFRGEIPSEMIKPLSLRGKIGIDAQGLLRCSEEGELLFRDWSGKKEFLPFVTYLKTDAAEAKILTGSSDREEAARILAGWGAREVMVTHNSEVIVLAEGKIHRAPLNPRILIGRTGRGDTCFAAYLSRRLKEGPEPAVRYAAALTSLKLERKGRFSGTDADVRYRMGETESPS